MTVRNMLFVAALALGGAGLVESCDSGEARNYMSKRSQYITVSTGIGEFTRVHSLADGSQVFSQGDQISVYAWTGDSIHAPAGNQRVVNNSVNTLVGDAWKAVPQMLWKNYTARHYFVGIYPHSDAPVDDLAAMPYTLDPANQEKSDLLVATNLAGVKNTIAPVALLFDHVMARVVVSLSFRNQFEGTPAVESVTLKNVATRATVDCLSKSVAADAAGAADILVPRNGSNAGEYASVVIPGCGARTIVVSIGGKEYTYTHSEDIATESGKYTTVSLIVGRDSVSLGSVSINPWLPGTHINGDAEL